MRNSKKITILVSLSLLVYLLYKLKSTPSGMFLTGFALGLTVISITVFGILISLVIVKAFYKKFDFWSIFFSLTIPFFLYFHYKLYSPDLKIVVPENYTGKINLVKSDVPSNVLTVDSNGIGYITDWTFNHSYKRPIVVDVNGLIIDSLLVGFNPTNFWSVTSSFSTNSDKKLISKSFKIVNPQTNSSKKEENQKKIWDTLMINEESVLIHSLDSAEIEVLKAENEDNFYTAVDDIMWYTNMLTKKLDSLKKPVIYTTSDYIKVFIENSEYQIIDTNTLYYQTIYEFENDSLKEKELFELMDKYKVNL
jgi:hypothetical protein